METSFLSLLRWLSCCLGAFDDDFVSEVETLLPRPIISETGRDASAPPEVQEKTQPTRVSSPSSSFTHKTPVQNMPVSSLFSSVHNRPLSSTTVSSPFSSTLEKPLSAPVPSMQKTPVSSLISSTLKTSTSSPPHSTQTKMVCSPFSSTQKASVSSPSHSTQNATVSSPLPFTQKAQFTSPSHSTQNATVSSPLPFTQKTQFTSPSHSTQNTTVSSPLPFTQKTQFTSPSHSTQNTTVSSPLPFMQKTQFTSPSHSTQKKASSLSPPTQMTMVSSPSHSIQKMTVSSSLSSTLKTPVISPSHSTQKMKVSSTSLSKQKIRVSSPSISTQKTLVTSSSHSSQRETGYSSSFFVPKEVTESSPRRSGSNLSSESVKQTLRRVVKGQGQESYTVVESNKSALYMIPERDKVLIENDLLPDVLKKPLTPSKYKEFFSALLYAEDYYCEKWSDYKLEEVTVELKRASVYPNSRKPKRPYENEENYEDKMFVVFRITDIPERRPFLLSRDFANARPSASDGRAECFQGIINKVVKSNLVLVEFKHDFHAQHHPGRKYDISFSFNRVCMKRAHEALNSLSDSLLKNFLFPETRVIRPHKSTNGIINSEKLSTVCEILKTEGAPPYLIAGPICVSEDKASAFRTQPSKTGLIICESVIQICKTMPHCKILICSPSNSACDVLMRSLKKAIPEPQMFRANAAFREKEDVPEDILSSSLYKKECFSCPQLEALSSFKVIFSTFISSYRLHSEGLPTGHFTHIFMVDSSFAIEPEALVPLANFAEANTSVIVAGKEGCSPRWVRSTMARKNGMKISYFERLKECELYRRLSSSYVTHLKYH